jgi:hypothetical protein
VTQQGNLMSDDIDDVIVNEENLSEHVTTNVTHESHEYDDNDTSRQKKVKASTY